MSQAGVCTLAVSCMGAQTVTVAAFRCHTRALRLDVVSHKDAYLAVVSYKGAYCDGTSPPVNAVYHQARCELQIKC